MGISKNDFESLDEAALSGLVEAGTPEGVLIEYKRDRYGSADADKKEFLKDLSSFANTAGGHLIIGIDESDGLPVKLSPITNSDPDSELQRLESLLRDGVEPRILGVRMIAIPVSAGGFVVVVRVPRSWAAPHRVTIKGTNRFYARTSAGAYELSVSELRAKFNASATAFDRAVALRERRMALIAADEGVVPLAKDDGRLTLHIVPLGSGDMLVDLERALELSDLLAPIAASGWSQEFNFDGFANVRSGEKIFGYTQLFRDGTIEATKVRIVATHEGTRRIPARSLGDPIIKAVPNYLSALSRLGVSPPLSVMITLEGVRGTYLGYSDRQWLDERATIRRDVLELPPSIIEEYAGPAEYEAALRPAFDALWNAGGLSRSTYFTEQNRWHPHQ